VRAFAHSATTSVPEFVRLRGRGERVAAEPVFGPLALPTRRLYMSVFICIVLKNDEIPSRSYKDLSNKRLGPGLRLSRSLGDLSAERDGLLTPTPEMCRHSVDSDDEILILASDGVFEFIDDAKAVTIVANVKAGGGSASDACASLVKQAALYWRLHEEGYRDDITCIVVYLQPALEALSPTD